MKVLKFGGTSIGSIEGVAQVLKIVKQQEQPVVVVFSALAGVTNLLEQCVKQACSGSPSYHDIISQIESQHLTIAKRYINPKTFSGVYANLKQLTNELTDKLDGIFQLHEASPRAADLVLSYGELLSLHLMGGILIQEIGGVSVVDARSMIFTSRAGSTERVETEATDKAIREQLVYPNGISITSGFIARSVHGYPTTLGRGGSDLTAALIAAAIDAETLEIWTDVSGIYTANPSITSAAYPIAELSYAEALELGHFGAKVIYPPSVQPVFAKKIPVLVKNTFASHEQGTLIVSSPTTNGDVVRAVSSVDGIALLSIMGSGMVGVTGIASRLFGALASESINVILITQASSEHSICIAIEESQIDLAREVTNRDFEYEISTQRMQPAIVQRGFAIVAVVGERLKQAVGISGQVFSALGRNGINIHAIAQGASELNISAVVKGNDCKKAVSVIHQNFFQKVCKTFHLYIVGVGNVGSAYIGQLSAQLAHLHNEHNICLRIAGLANSKRMAFDVDGIDPQNYLHKLADSHLTMSIAGFVDQMVSHNLANSIFVDITASQQVSDCYHSVLAKSISVVTCNKIAAASEYASYVKLKATAKAQGVYFKYETNVGAGLPIIQTISNMVKSGDTVHSVEAVVSGSFNFIINQMEGGASFSQSVANAVEQGYTEPNPLIDLRGYDVQRKLLILAREAMLPMEMNDVVVEPYLPSPLPKEYQQEEFSKQLSQYDSYFAKLFADTAANNQKLRLVARLADGKASVALVAVDASHPLFNLKGNDNIVSIRSSRYNPNPLVIKGAGAGAAVTAMGIFADILSIVNS